ncbi:hypothetical protein [Lysobacter sp. H23M47]|uniref:hypothetical protein n=1 Tax=Lysobacter sp. H23M47 TaxID=2781024 RepID=UPI00187E19A4|nr:hypothetical protein [Lysobacter sp. H23M47]QOW24233.1 hypothetical protein INQ43_11080 [Lysobacter sp. H23M47]
MRAALALAALLAVSPLALAKSECQIDLGQGWPPATRNHGTAVEALFAAGDTPVLSLVRLPPRGKETGVMLVRSANGQTWTVRSAVAAERVDAMTTIPGGIERTLKVDKPAKVRESVMPAALAERVVASWGRALSAVVPEDRAAAFQENELLVFAVNDRRVSGTEPSCGPSRLLARQAQVLIDAADSKDKHLPKRWSALVKLLDQLDTQLATAP